jgi:hypothetical protein
MAAAISFDGTNAGLQAGIIYGSVVFNAPPGKLQVSELTSANDGPALERPETPPNPSVVIPFSRDIDFVERGILD